MRSKVFMVSAIALLLAGGNVAVRADSHGGPGFYSGSGGGDNNFTIGQAGEVQLGLRGSLRQNANPALIVGNTYFVPTGPQTEITSGGNGSNVNRAAWGIDYSLNTQITNGTSTASNGHLTLADVKIVASMSDDFGHSFTGTFLPPSDSNTWGIGGKSSLSAISPAYNTAWGVQNTTNAAFGDFFIKGDNTFIYNMNDPNTFHLTMTAYLNSDISNSNPLASDSININVSNDPAAAAAAPVPEPATLSVLGVMGASFLFRRRRKTA